MSGWRLSLRSPVEGRVDARGLQLARLLSCSLPDVEAIPLRVDGWERPLADFFAIRPLSCDRPRLVIEGSLRNFDYLAAHHAAGEFYIEGSAGHQVGAAMSGGMVVVSGDIGDFAGSPIGSQSSGMRGGRLLVTGSSGTYSGHRLRRGEIFVEGVTGAFAACDMVAGTLVVAGGLGEHPAYGMRRGSLLSDRLPQLPSGRFSSPRQGTSIFLTLLDRSLRAEQHRLPRATELIKAMASSGVHGIRGDRAVRGQGEILAPA